MAGAKARPSAAPRKESKKMGSLSSFQSTLNFSALPPAPFSSSSSSSSSTSTSRPASSARTVIQKSKPAGLAGPSAPRPPSRDRDADSRLMPPPVAGVRAKPRILGAVAGKTATATATAGRFDQAIEVLDDEDDEDVRVSLVGQSDTVPTSSMWAERYAPDSVAELAPGKARVASVKEWLHLALYGHPSDARPEGPNRQREIDKVRRYKRVLLVTGPSGAGKTTVVRTLASEMGVDLVEWGEGVEEYALGSNVTDRESPVTKLATFISRNDYAPLAMSQRSAPTPASTASPSRPIRPRAILLTSLPNLSHLPTREAFHTVLGNFCKSYSSSSCPLIIVHSEAGSRGVAEESWRDRDRAGREGMLEVLGKDVAQGPFYTQIEFLPIAPTFMIKALRRVLELARGTHDFEPPTAAALQLVALTSNGDLRSAVNSVQLLCTHSSQSTDHGRPGRKRKGTVERGRGGKRVAVIGKDARGWVKSRLDVPDDIRSVLDALTRKEQNLNLFHALGRIFYNKRLGDPGDSEQDQELVQIVEALPRVDRLPGHLREYERARSLVQIDDYIGGIPVDASSLALWLEQSMPAFCHEVEEVDAVLEYLGAADVLRSDDDFWQSSPQAISYALHLSIRGVLHGLPSPVPRKGQKILKPHFFQALKDQRTNSGLIDTAAAYLARKAVMESCALAETALGKDVQGVDSGLGVWGGVQSQGVLATEMLPMMTKMQRLTTRPLLPASTAPLRLPPYHTIGSVAEELTATQGNPGDDEEIGRGDDADLHLGGWDMEEMLEETEDLGWLQEDDIADFDD